MFAHRNTACLGAAVNAMGAFEAKPASCHECNIYESEEQRTLSLITFLVDALKRQEKLVVIADPINARANLSALERAEIDLQAHVAMGQLRVLTVHQTFLRSGSFDPQGMVSWLRAETSRALDEGHHALRAAAEMTWMLLGGANTALWLEYEKHLGRAMFGHECRVLCQFDGRRLPADIRQLVLEAHCSGAVEATLHSSVHSEGSCFRPRSASGGIPSESSV